MLDLPANFVRTLPGFARSLCAAAAVAVLATTASGQVILNELPKEAKGLDVVEKIGDSLPMDLEFVNSAGKTVKLGSYFPKTNSDGSANHKPTIIGLVYYQCPIVCSVLMEKIHGTINEIDYTIGKDFNVLMFSFDPREQTSDAARVRKSFMDRYTKPVDETVAAGWQFHTTPNDLTTRKLADSLGFQYRLLENGQYSHPVAMFIVTPEGKISRYLYGYSQEPKNLKLALIEASQGKLVRTVGERLMNFCYMYDPSKGGYTLRAFRVMQLGGILTLIGLATLVGGLLLVERVRRKQPPPGDPPSQDVITIPNQSQ